MEKGIRKFYKEEKARKKEPCITLQGLMEKVEADLPLSQWEDEKLQSFLNAPIPEKNYKYPLRNIKL